MKHSSLVVLALVLLATSARADQAAGGQTAQGVQSAEIRVLTAQLRAERLKEELVAAQAELEAQRELVKRLQAKADEQVINNSDINSDTKHEHGHGDNHDHHHHDHYEFAELLGTLVPYVECEAEFIKESKFRIFLGYVDGEMLITCSKGIRGEEFTTVARIVGAEIGIGWKTHIEEGIMRIHGLGIGPHNFLGASVQLKAALSGGDYQTYGQGGMVSLGVAGSMFQYIGFVHATATVTGYGGALTLEIAVWAPECDGEEGRPANGCQGESDHGQDDHHDGP